MNPDVGKIPVDDKEPLARYIHHKSHVRADGTVKQDPFIPYKHVELSLTRHVELSEREIWEIGGRVSLERSESLHGRADVEAVIYRSQKLRVIPDSIPDNPNHTLALDWPAEKQLQKEKALVIAQAAKFVLCP